VPGTVPARPGRANGAQIEMKRSNENIAYHSFRRADSEINVAVISLSMGGNNS
jgi:hypothetical protein